MMRYAVILVGFMLASPLLGQNNQVLYGLEEVPQALLLNPGSKVPQKKHFGIPLLSKFHLNGGASGVSVHDIFQEGGDINERIGQKIAEMDEKDFFTAHEQLVLLDIGWRSAEEIYYSGGVYQELDFILYFPADLAKLAWEGNAVNLDYPFDLGEVSALADLLTVYHFGANKAFGDKWTIGARAKIYSSILSARSVNNQGTFITVLGDEDSPNIYEHQVVDGDMTLQTSGIASLDDGVSAGQLVGRGIFGGNLGVGMDIGATYDINARWTASASLLDIGAVFHTKDVENYQARGSYTLDGIELLFPPLSEGQPAPPYYDDLEQEIEDAIPVDTLYNSYTVMRPVKANASVKYSFGRPVGGEDECDCRSRGKFVERAQAVGAQFYGISRPKGWQMAGTVYYYRRLWSWLSAKATYTVDPYTSSNVGLGVVGDFGRFNFFIASDNVLNYGNIAKAKSLSLQFGFNLKIADP